MQRVRVGRGGIVVIGGEQKLIEGPPALRSFLKPRLEAGKLWFTLDEAILIARKPA